MLAADIADALIMLMDKMKKLFGMLTIFPIVYSAFLSLSQLVTLPKNNISPEHGWLED